MQGPAPDLTYTCCWRDTSASGFAVYWPQLSRGHEQPGVWQAGHHHRHHRLSCAPCSWGHHCHSNGHQQCHHRPHHSHASDLQRQHGSQRWQYNHHGAPHHQRHGQLGFCPGLGGCPVWHLLRGCHSVTQLDAHSGFSPHGGDGSSSNGSHPNQQNTHYPGHARLLHTDSRWRWPHRCQASQAIGVRPAGHWSLNTHPSSDWSWRGFRFERGGGEGKSWSLSQWSLHGWWLQPWQTVGKCAWKWTQVLRLDRPDGSRRVNGLKMKWQTTWACEQIDFMVVNTGTPPPPKTSALSRMFGLDLCFETPSLHVFFVFGFWGGICVFFVFLKNLCGSISSLWL